jgi:RNA polymerase sigma-70 factor, ECF subfamily
VSDRRLEPEALGDHVDRLFRAAWALTGDRYEAEDLVQDTYAKVLARPRFVRGSDDLAYLLRALANQHTSRFRRRRRRPPEVPLEHAVADQRSPEGAYEVRELFATIAALEPDGRAAIVAVDVVGLSYAEAAELLELKEATLATRLHRARRAVASRLTSDPAVPR